MQINETSQLANVKFANWLVLDYPIGFFEIAFKVFQRSFIFLFLIAELGVLSLSLLIYELKTLLIVLSKEL